MYPAEEPYADRVNRLLASIAEGVLDEGIIHDCPWDDFRSMYFKGKDSYSGLRTRRLGAAAANQVKFELRREGGVIYVFWRRAKNQEAPPASLCKNARAC